MTGRQVKTYNVCSGIIIIKWNFYILWFIKYKNKDSIVIKFIPIPIRTIYIFTYIIEIIKSNDMMYK